MPQEVPSSPANQALRDLSRQLGQAMLADRAYLRRELRFLQLRDLPDRDAHLARVRESLLQSIQLAEHRRTVIPKITYPANLPVAGRAAEIAEAIRANQVVIICGATGSGKTTQIPKICLEIGRGIHGMIGHTQPRRIAARSVAHRLAEELGTSVGGRVGFKVRFSDHVSTESLIKLMTDGILLAEIAHDRMLWQYDTIILDEAHERSLNIDFLIGYLQRLLPRRPDLKLIITSATIAPERFARHFGDAPILNVEGRTYPVEVRYQPFDCEPDEQDYAQEQAIVRAVAELWQSGPGDTLIFLSGERDIRNTAETLRKHHPRGVEILPLYARLSVEDQMRVFANHGHPRLILATNVAETSLTVPGIKYVIDPGLARISRYGGRGSVQRLPIEPISQASADQRKGRCGRTGPGVCVRLYAEASFTSRPEFTDPEIWRTNLASVILQMKALRLGRIEDFPFLDPPDYRQIRDGYQTLHEIGAIDEHNELTDIGRLLARLPVDPKLSRMIIASAEQDCLDDMLIIASALAVQDPRERPMDQQSNADTAHDQFKDPASDFLSILKLWNIASEQQRHLSENKLRKWCRDNFISFTRLREWNDVHSQLREMAAGFLKVQKRRRTDNPAEPIHRAVLTGLISNVGVKGEDFEYAGLRGKHFFIFPGSTQFSKKPSWIVSAELVQTTRMYARTVAPVLPDWIEQAAAHMVRREYTDPAWQSRRGEVIAYEKVSLQGLTLIHRRPVDYGPVDPKTAREMFIHGALVVQDFLCDAPFFRENGKLRRHIESLEARQRKKDLLADNKVIFDFYDRIIPAEVVSAQTFNQWRHRAEMSNRRVLFMKESDLLVGDKQHITEKNFPSTLTVGDTPLQLEYRYEVGHPADGVTVRVPISILPQLDDAQLDWLVPGLLKEKIVQLLRSLPKEIRTQLVPHPHSADTILSRMAFGEGDFYKVLAFEAGRIVGKTVDPKLFKRDELDTHLKMNIRVVDHGGKILAAGRSAVELRQKLRIQARAAVQQKSAQWHRDNLKEWNFGDLPERIDFRSGPLIVQGYPALTDNGVTASLRLLENPLAAAIETRKGVRRLAMIALSDALSWQFRMLTNIDRLMPLYCNGKLGDKNQLRETFCAALAERLMFADAKPIRTKVEFELRLDNAWNHLRPTAEQLGKTAQAIFTHYADLNPRLNRDYPPLLLPAINDMRDHLKRLCPSNVLSIHPWEWLMHVPRFLDGIRIRLHKLTNAGLLKDGHNSAMIAPLWEAYLARKRALDQSGQIDPELVQFRYLVEELRVSLYAQELKTSVPVSVAKLQKSLGAA